MVHFNKNTNGGWSPNQNISDAFFQDSIKWKASSKEYAYIIKEMKDALKYAHYLLDYENATLEEKNLLLRFSKEFYSNFSKIRPDYIDNHYVNKIYRNSIEELIQIIEKNV